MLFAIFFDVMLPNSHFRAVWDLGVLSILICTSVTLPVGIAFHDSDVSSTSLLKMVLLIANVAFFVDIYMNFRTAVLDLNDELVTSHKGIALVYIKSAWFPLDVLAAMPIDILFSKVRKVTFDTLGMDEYA